MAKAKVSFKGGEKGDNAKGAPPQGPVKGQETRQCFKCHEYGHIGKDRPKPDKRTAKKSAKSFEELSQARSEALDSLAGSARSLTSTGGHVFRPLPTRRALSTLAAKTAPVDVAVSGSCGNTCRVSNSIDSVGVVSGVGKCRTAKVITNRVCLF